MSNEIGAIVAENRAKYALLIMGLQAGAVTPDYAARQVLADLQANGVDVRAGAKKWRAALEKAFGQHAKIVDAFEALLPPEDGEPAPPQRPAHARAHGITIREIRR